MPACVCVPQVNDFVRDKFTDKDNTIPIFAEIMAGGCVSTRSQTLLCVAPSVCEGMNEHYMRGKEGAVSYPRVCALSYAGH